MRRWWWMSIIWAALAAHAEIVDRIAVSVGHSVITEADLQKETRVTAFLNGEKPDFSAENKRRTAERMVDQTLLRGELELSRFPLPTAAETAATLKEVKDHYPNDAAWRRALAEYGISEADLRARLTWQLTLVRFIDIRFRPGIQIGDDEIRNYFNEHLRPELEKTHPGRTPSAENYRDSIEQTLISQAADKQVEEWLQQARRRARITFHEEVFR
jgi:peptidyl-prolyl cis-trans isomerase SurA